ncbi:zinc metallopeptidase [Ruficoccus amylovorans]|uniref:Zinc metallopeptidase n=1 Tax=Ruficoccus amylovorans TaxID=1804625 RepID=A0A842HAN8_9BACT|nr:zinc metallopeptidase [Ruficoccus amylovorans]MBC2593415.1 zinc metallopeptidase [Ruficoccus amylovorans]
MNTILSLSFLPGLGFIIPAGGGWGLWLVLIVPTIILGFWAQHRVMSTYKKYSQVPSRGRITGAEAASAVIRKAGINDVEIVEIGGQLSDHYDPIHKRLALSSANYRGTSLAALGVAAHEAGHAIQHKVGYKALQLRMSLIPITTMASQILPIVLIASFFLPMLGMMGIKIAVVCYLILTIFQLITLPVEFDASARARKELVGIGIIGQDEAVGVVRTLNAAGWTYVAAFISSLASLLYLFLISRDR